MPVSKSTTVKGPGISKSSLGSSSLEKFFHNSLKDLYWAEKNLLKTLPKMSKNATTEELQSALDEHLVQTEEHVNRLEKIFEMIGERAQAKKCEAMEGLIKEGETIMEETKEDSLTRDVGIIAAAQKVEHYEISSYGTLTVLAKTLGFNEAAELLAVTLEEEKQADIKLTSIAENNINIEAEQED